MRSLLFVLLALLMTAWGTSFPSPQRLGALTMRPFGAASLNSSQKRVSASILHASRRPVSRGPVGGKKGKDRTVRIGGNRVALSATNILIGANIFTFLVTWLYPGMKMRWAKNDRAIRYYGQSYRFLTSLFVHGSAQHVLMNSYSLYNIGPAVEHAFGTLRFVLTYLAAGILANCATFATGSSPLSLGASGCTFGLIGALATYSYRNKAVLGPNADAMLSSLKQTMLINLLYGFSMQGIDNSAHIYGALAGAAAAFIIGPRLQRFSISSGGDGRRRSGVADRPLVSVKKVWGAFAEFFSNTSFNRIITNRAGSGSSSGKRKRFYPKGRPIGE